MDPIVAIKGGPLAIELADQFEATAVEREIDVVMLELGWSNQPSHHMPTISLPPVIRNGMPTPTSPSALLTIAVRKLEASPGREFGRVQVNLVIAPKQMVLGPSRQQVARVDRQAARQTLLTIGGIDQAAEQSEAVAELRQMIEHNVETPTSSPPCCVTA